MNKQVEELYNKIKLTKEQIKAIEKLNKAFDKCVELGVDFVYDFQDRQLTAVNLSNTEMHYTEELEDDDENYIAFSEVGTSILPDSCYDDVMYEVGPTTYYNDEYDQICFTPIPE